MTKPLSIKLLNTLQKAKALLDKDALLKIAGFVDSQRTGGSLFVGKNRKVALYYTSFGCALAYILGVKLAYTKADAYLLRQEAAKPDLVHYAAYMRYRLLRQLAKNGKLAVALCSLFAAKAKDLHHFSSWPHNDSQSPYATFVWLCMAEDAGQKIKNRKQLIDRLSAYRSASGGYKNTPNSTAATTNATAAALAVIGQLNGYKPNADVSYLYNLQHTSGGFCATEATPIPDLLSTATALFVLSCYGVKPKYPAKAFVEAHWLESGGFSATLLDDKSDVEYTFYGLLALGAEATEVVFKNENRIQ